MCECEAVFGRRRAKIQLRNHFMHGRQSGMGSTMRQEVYMPELCYAYNDKE
jgi:hypothetical protein